MNFFRCDICGTETMVNPPTRPVVEKKILEVVVGNQTVDGKQVPVVEKREVEVPVTEKLRTMDFNTMEMVEYDVKKVIDLKPRAHIINLRTGQQTVQRDFCTECLDKVMPEIKALWDKLESIGSK